MKVFTRITWSMSTGEVLESENFDYDGPVALCGGGGSDAPKPPPPPKPRQEVTAITKRARAEQSAKASRSFGQLSTLMTGGLGETELAQTSGKKLLGR
jgi:hypothetical protein